MRLACCLNYESENRKLEDFEAVWNGYLRLYNLFQFISHSYFVTREGLSGKAYDDLRFGEKISPEAGKEEPESAAWAGIFELTDTELHDLLDRLMGNGWPVPEVGYELTDEKGEIVATAELGWPELRIAFLRKDEMDFKKTFEEMGWRPLSLAEVCANPDLYLSMNRP